jgi:hypothetical protein
MKLSATPHFFTKSPGEPSRSTFSCQSRSTAIAVLPPVP